MSRIGEYYLNGTHRSSPARPIRSSCRARRTGTCSSPTASPTRTSLPTTTVGDQDDTVPAGQLPVGGTAGSGHRPHAGRAVAARRSARTRSRQQCRQQFRVRLRDQLLGDRPAALRCPNNVATSARDPASWPHQNFAAMSLGTEGKLPAGNQSIVEAQLTAGTLQWPKPYPTVIQARPIRASTICGTRRSTGAAVSSTRSRPTN